MRLIFAIVISLSAGGQVLEGLYELRWQNRIIVLHEMANHAEVLQQLNDHQSAIDERDILWFVLQADQVKTNHSGVLAKNFAQQLRSHHSWRPNQVILIGKDGGLKSSFDGLHLNAVFAEVDAMPMRKREMQQ